METKNLLNVSVYDLELSVRSRKSLQAADIKVLHDLLIVTEADLLRSQNFGQVSLREISAALGKHGLMIGQSAVPNEDRQLPELPDFARAKLRRLNIRTLQQVSQFNHCSLSMIVGTEIDAVKAILKTRGLSLADGEPLDHHAMLGPKTTFWEISHILPTRLRNVLLQAGWSPEMTLKEMSEWTETELLSMKGIAETGIMDLKCLLQKADIKLNTPIESVDPEIKIACNTLIQDLFENDMVSARAKNVLRQLGVTTLGQATQLSKETLRSYKNVGETTIAEIDDLLKRGEMRDQPSREERKLQQPVSVLNPSARTAYCFEGARIETLGDLTSKTVADLLRIRSFGKTSLCEVEHKLAERGLYLADRLPPQLFDAQYEPDEVMTRKVQATIGRVREPQLDIEVEVRGGTLIVTPADQEPITFDYEDRRLKVRTRNLTLNVEKR